MASSYGLCIWNLRLGGAEVRVEGREQQRQVDLNSRNPGELRWQEGRQVSVAGIFFLKCGVNPVRVVTSVQKVISVAVWSCGESTELEAIESKVCHTRTWIQSEKSEPVTNIGELMKAPGR